MLWRLALLAALSATGTATAADEIARFEARGRFDDIKDSVVSAIEGRGLVVSAISQVGDMLERTGHDLGANRRIYDKAVVLEFCSASVSRRMLEADPHQLVYCPYAIAVYNLPDTPGKVFVAYRRHPADRPVLAEVDSLLKGIVADALK